MSWGRYRALQANDAGVLQGQAHLHRLVLILAFCGVDHNLHFWTNCFLYRLYQRHLTLRFCPVAQSEFYLAVALFDMVLGLLLQRIQWQAIPEGVADVGPHSIPVTTQQTIKGLFQRLSLGISYCDLQSCHGHIKHAAGACPAT